MREVVVGVDHAVGRDAAIRWASSESVIRRLPLVLVHPWHLPLGLSIDLEPTSLPGLSGPVTCVAQPGSVRSAVLARDAAMIVLPTQLALRRDVRHHLHEVGVPLVSVPHRTERATRRVVVGVCGTHASRVALGWAAHEARLRRAELVVVHAWQLHPTSAREMLQPTRALPGHQECAERALLDWVQSVLPEPTVELHAEHGAPVDRLLEVGSDADLIVLGRHIAGAVGRFVHGTIGADVMKLADCPVVIVPTSSNGLTR